MPISSRCGCAGQLDADALAARVADRDRAVVAQRGVEHVDEHRLVARRHQRDVGQTSQVGDVEGAVVGRAVVADEAGAVHAEHDRQALEADVVDDLVVGALQEGRVDGDHRAGALDREAGGEQDGLLLGDADVEVALGQRLLEDREAGAGVHRGGDADHALVAVALAHERLAEHLRVLRRRGLGVLGLGRGGRRHALGDRLRLGRVPLLHALEAALLGGREALALDGGDVDDDRALGLERVAQRGAQSSATSWPSMTPM